MTRKGKLVPSERHKKLSCHGTQTTRLTTDSQLKFGDCCLQLEPAKDPVATPSGHIYSREAIVSYLLSKTQGIQEQKKQYELKISSIEQKQKNQQEQEDKKTKNKFILKDQGGIRQDISNHKSSINSKLKRKIDIETVEEGRHVLKRTSYWLADSKSSTITTNKDESILPSPPPSRPSSPNSGQPLKLKDLIPLEFKKDNDNNITCCVTGKNMSTQNVIVIKKTSQVMLKSSYDELVKGDKESSSKNMICPITGKKFKEKDVISLVKASTGFAASGIVEVKTYIPTLT